MRESETDSRGWRRCKETSAWKASRVERNEWSAAPTERNVARAPQERGNGAAKLIRNTSERKRNLVRKRGLTTRYVNRRMYRHGPILRFRRSRRRRGAEERFA